MIKKLMIRKHTQEKIYMIIHSQYNTKVMFVIIYTKHYYN